ncbi:MULTISPECIES: hypothetical protein [unclassified Shewanella]|jgi:hypothetical protein|nr:MULTISPECIES: hypothetical protein [unclassified Shewanella]
MVKSLMSVALIMCCTAFPSAVQQVRIQPAQSSENTTYQYYYDLL